ncbi:hypothetical protein A2U01_0103786 [Trifolium medium]|uniref:Uncharacterized protein n=1 Tax=Trifolium medium TaxID=97028 RepID=A0A392V4Y9_9FABA|nr:hypothetical protein [Trifolium medium]
MDKIQKHTSRGRAVEGLAEPLELLRVRLATVSPGVVTELERVAADFLLLEEEGARGRASEMRK